jgi:hypothetical protein
MEDSQVPFNQTSTSPSKVNPEILLTGSPLLFIHIEFGELVNLKSMKKDKTPNEPKYREGTYFYLIAKLLIVLCSVHDRRQFFSGSYHEDPEYQQEQLLSL